MHKIVGLPFIRRTYQEKKNLPTDFPLLTFCFSEAEGKPQTKHNDSL